MQTHLLKKALAVLLAGASSVCAAQDDPPLSHKLTLGAYYGKGSYGAERDTTIRYFPLSYEVSRFPWIVSLTVPWLGLEGPGDVFLEAGNVGRPESNGATLISGAGLGDVLLSGTWQFEPLFDGFAFLDFTVQAKLPTADEREGMGTGETDLGAQFDLYKSIGDTTLFSTLGYRHRGRTPLYDLRDSLYLSFGLMQQLNERSYLGLLYDYREAASESAFESHELMPFYSWAPDGRWNLMVYTILGFTDSSADRTLGLQLSYRWP